MGWEQPRENSIAALVHGMNHLDGVELDLRLTSDDDLVLHHDDSFASGSYVENYTLAELVEKGDSFSALLSQTEFTEPWQNEGKCVCIELKSPHPSSGKGGGWLAGSARTVHLARMLELVHDALEPFTLPRSSVVLYSFDPRFLKAAKQVNSPYERARLVPHLREWGSSRMKRIIAAPSFITNSLPRLIRKHRRWGAPMIPCALDYLHGSNRLLVTGTSVGLEGRGLERLTRARKGFPAFVWPVPPELESKLLDAGLTAITDFCSPELVELPCGTSRRPRPATQPLGEARWHEMDDGERRELLDGWRNKWQWERSIDELCADSAPNSIPWEVPRIIGHRGAGRTYSKD